MKLFCVRLIVITILMLGFLAGCVGSKPYQKATMVPGKSLIYVFRPESVFARGEMFKLEVNRSMQGMLLNNAYIPVHINPGQVTVEVFQNSLVTKPRLATLTITTKAGETYYVKAKPGLAWQVELLQIDKEQGAKEIGGTAFYDKK